MEKARTIKNPIIVKSQRKWMEDITIYQTEQLENALMIRKPNGSIIIGLEQIPELIEALNNFIKK